MNSEVVVDLMFLLLVSRFSFQSAGINFSSNRQAQKKQLFSCNDFTSHMIQSCEQIEVICDLVVQETPKDIQGNKYQYHPPIFFKHSICPIVCSPHICSF